MKEDEEYAGLRLKLDARSAARVPIQIDLGFGDAVTPGPDEITRLQWRHWKRRDVGRLVDHLERQRGKEIHTCEGHIHSISSLAFSPDGARFASADGTGKIKVWDVKTGKELKTIAGNGSLRFTPDGAHLVYKTTEEEYEDRSLQFLNLETGKTVALKESQRPVYGVALRPDGTCIAGIAGNRIKLWDVRMGETIKTLKGHVQGYQRMAFSLDGAWLVTGGEDRTVRLWDCRNLGDGWTVDAKDEVAFSPDGKMVATAGEAIQFSDARDGRKLRELKNHTDHVTSVAFSPDGKLLASTSKDKTARVWNVATGEELAVLKDGQIALETRRLFRQQGKPRLLPQGHRRCLRGRSRYGTRIGPQVG